MTRDTPPPQQRPSICHDLINLPGSGDGAGTFPNDVRVSCPPPGDVNVSCPDEDKVSPPEDVKVSCPDDLVPAPAVKVSGPDHLSNAAMTCAPNDAVVVPTSGVLLTVVTVTVVGMLMRDLLVDKRVRATQVLKPNTRACRARPLQSVSTRDCM